MIFLRQAEYLWFLYKLNWSFTEPDGRVGSAFASRSKGRGFKSRWGPILINLIRLYMAEDHGTVGWCSSSSSFIHFNLEIFSSKWVLNALAIFFSSQVIMLLILMYHHGRACTAEFPETILFLLCTFLCIHCSHQLHLRYLGAPHNWLVSYPDSRACMDGWMDLWMGVKPN